MAEIDHYQVLGLEMNASPAQIRRAFRALALRYHPDQNLDDPDAEERFKLVTQAYKVLIDSKKRWHYDRARRAAQTQRNRTAERARRRAEQKRETASSAQAGSSRTPGAASGGVADHERRQRPWWEEVRERLREEEQPSQPPPPPPPEPEPESADGKDLHVDMTITSQMADLGGRQPLAVSRFETCDVCEGTGAKPGTVIRPCPECEPDYPSPKCYLCSGRGKLIQAFCSKCGGDGRVRATKTVVVTVRPRSKKGQEICLPGEGMPPAREGGKAGDLIVHLVVKAGTDYEQRDDAVYSEVYVTPATAAMGGIVRIKTVDASAELTIPPGTRSGTVFRIEGVGPILVGRERGDHYVTVKIIET